MSFQEVIMKRYALAVATVVMLVAADDAKDDAAKSDMKKMQGTWQVVLLEHNDKISQGDDIKDWKVAINGDRYTMTMGSITEEGTFKIDPTKKPKNVELIPIAGSTKGEKRLGIYELKGDEGKVCVAPVNNETRPKEFAGKTEEQWLWVFKREKP
jgi:uncharacterized protein (TIGR03067 family)